MDVLTVLVHAGVVHRRESALPRHRPHGEPQPGARQQRRIVLRLCWLGTVAGAVLRRLPGRVSLRQLGLDLVEKRGLDRFKARVYLVFGDPRHSLDAARSAPRRDLLRRAFDAAQETGDLTYAAYSCNQSDHEPARHRRSARRRAARGRGMGSSSRGKRDSVSSSTSSPRSSGSSGCCGA